MKEIFDIVTGEKIEYKSQFRNPSNYEFGQFHKDIEEKTGISMTVPDLSYTVREILEKFTRGVPMELNNEGTYEELEDFTGLEPENAIDITEVEEQLSVVNSRIETAKAKKLPSEGEAEKVATQATKEAKESGEVPQANEGKI